MLSDLNTIVQFFSALYVTIAIDNMMFNRFWTPDVFAVVENALKKFDFALSTPKQKELLNVIKNRSVEIDTRARREGAFYLMLCVSLLIYFAFEGLLSETNQCRCCFVILMDMAMVFGLYIIGAFEWKRWWEVWFRYIFAVIAAFVWLYLTSNASLKILSLKDFAISKNVSITFLARILIILVFLVPIVMRIVINWLYSTVYVKYLDVRLTEEYVAYQNTKKAIRSKNKDLCDFRYDGVYKEVFFSADKSQDNVETVLVNKLLDYLSFACKPVRVLELLCYRFSADYRNDNNNVSKGNEEASYELPE